MVKSKGEQLMNAKVTVNMKMHVLQIESDLSKFFLPLRDNPDRFYLRI